jgi:adenylate kinase family enzyme
MRRIVIVGTAGAGKSTLARQLGKLLQIPVIHLDALNWQPGWKVLTKDEFRSRLSEAIAGDAWITDGNYALLTFDIRMPRADLVIWVEQPILRCLWRVAKRAIQTQFRAEERLADGCKEDIGRLWERVRFIARFNRVNRPRIEAARMIYGANVPVIVLRGDKALSSFLRNLPA